MHNQGTLTPESVEGSRFIIESETAHDARNWRSDVLAWNAHDAHHGRFHVCRCDGDADDGDGAMKTSIRLEIGPCKIKLDVRN